MAFIAPNGLPNVKAKCIRCGSPFLVSRQNPYTLGDEIDCTSCGFRMDEDDLDVFSPTSFSMDTLREAQRKLDDITKKTKQYQKNITLGRFELPKVCRRCGLANRLEAVGEPMPLGPGASQPIYDQHHERVTIEAHCSSCDSYYTVEARRKEEINSTRGNEYILTILMKNGDMIRHKHACDGELPPWIKFTVPRPEKLSDPRMHWNEHLSGIDLNVEIFKANHFAGTVYRQE